MNDLTPILIDGGHLVSPADGLDRPGRLLLRRGRIEAIDLPDDRVTWSTIVERVIVPRPPRLTSPDHSELWYETAQAELDRAAAFAREDAPRAFVPGAGILYERSAADMAWKASIPGRIP
jgi:predicted amidohydrolase